MSRGIRENAPTPIRVALVEQCGAELENIPLGSVQILDRHIEMKLLRASRVWPSRRLEVLHSLECENEPVVGMQDRPAITERPSPIRLVHHTTEKRSIEPGQLADISTVQHHTLQLRDHKDQRRLPPDSVGSV